MKDKIEAQKKPNSNNEKPSAKVKEPKQYMLVNTNSLIC